MGRVKKWLLPGLILAFLAGSTNLNMQEVRAEESLMDAWERQNREANQDSCTADEPGTAPYNNTPQLSEDDIRQMNQGNAEFLYKDQRYLTFLRGKFYDEQVTDAEKGVESLMGIANLLGLSKGSEFFAVYGEQDEYGYTYLTYKQRYGDLTLENAVLKIILDPQGYTAGLVSSFTPNVGIAPEEEFSITAREAEQIVLIFYPGY